MNTQIDELPLTSLPGRYGVVRSQIYNRLNALGIETYKRGTKAYVNGSQLAQLDQLHQMLTEQDMTLETAAAVIRNGQSAGLTTGQVNRPESLTRQSTGLTTGQPDWMPLVAMALAQQATPHPNPLQRFEQLQALADHGWRPGTSELAAILGLKSLSGQSFERYGFRFTRVGKNGAQSAWQVEKL